MHSNIDELRRQWDMRAASAKSAQGGYYEMDALNWFNYLAFDVIGDLAFGAPFGMLKEGRDFAEVRLTPDAEPTFAPAIEVLNRRGEVSGYALFYAVLLNFYSFSILPKDNIIWAKENEQTVTDTITAPSASSPNSNPTPSTFQTPSSPTASKPSRTSPASPSPA
jgi:hypothetical protein